MRPSPMGRPLAEIGGQQNARARSTGDRYRRCGDSPDRGVGTQGPPLAPNASVRVSPYPRAEKTVGSRPGQARLSSATTSPSPRTWSPLTSRWACSWRIGCPSPANTSARANCVWPVVITVRWNSKPLIWPLPTETCSPAVRETYQDADTAIPNPTASPACAANPADHVAPESGSGSFVRTRAETGHLPPDGIRSRWVPALAASFLARRRPSAAQPRSHQAQSIEAICASPSCPSPFKSGCGVAVTDHRPPKPHFTRLRRTAPPCA